MYSKMDLPYEENALEPNISGKTVNIHYNKHYIGYLNKLNKLLADQNYNKAYSKEELVNHINMFDINVRDDILYNLGGVLNHELYFYNMSPNKNVRPTGKLLNKINEQFGNFENFKEDFIKNSQLLVGSGYTFLVINQDKNLEIINMINQETPYIYNLIPIMTIDLWEHAYYLDYQNNRNEYIDNFFQIIDFEKVNAKYEQNI